MVNGPCRWVSRLLEERDKYEALLSRGLADDKTFRNTLNQARPRARGARQGVAGGARTATGPGQTARAQPIASALPLAPATRC